MNLADLDASIYYLKAGRRRKARNTCKFEILTNRPRATAVHCPGRTNLIPSLDKLDARKHFCMVEGIVEEAICLLRKAAGELSL
jgi:hypothetical protein